MEIYTLDGIFKATASEQYLGYGGRNVRLISSKCNQHFVVVSAETYNRKMQDESPVFYNC